MTVPVAAGRSAELYVGQGVALGLAGSCSGAVELELGAARASPCAAAAAGVCLLTVACRCRESTAGVETQGGRTALLTAIQHHQDALALRLLDRGADMEARTFVRQGLYTERISEAAWAA